MKPCFFIGFLLVSAGLLMSCESNIYPAQDYGTETWPCEVQTHPSPHWTRNADCWFFTGQPNATERMNRRAPANTMSIKQIPVDNFTRLKVNGRFQVQIFGTREENNTLFIFGPTAAVNQIDVKAEDEASLTVLQKPEDTEGKNYYQLTAERKRMEQVIVRIGMQKLNKLEQLGCGKIEGFNLCSDGLDLRTCPLGGGDIYLSGNTQIRRVSHRGFGTVTVLNTHTPFLTIQTYGGGTVNVNGNIGIRSIDHAGSGNINIIGANTKCLCIHSKGSGRIGVKGMMNLREVIAKDNSHVYAYYVSSDKVRARACDNARIGLAGCTRELYVDTYDCSRFEGRQLHTRHSYVRAFDLSHINVLASDWIFASASERGSIYYFGPAKLLSKFESGYGSSIIPMGFDFVCNVCRAGCG